MRLLFIGFFALLIACGIEESTGPESSVSPDDPGDDAGAGPASPRPGRLAIGSGFTLRPGQDTALQATAYDADGFLVQSPKITWNTSAPAVAQVSSTGLVKGMARGRATISANWEGLTASAEVEIGEWSVVMDTDWSALNLVPGAQLPVRVVLRDSLFREWHYPVSTSWSSIHPNVATVAGWGAVDGQAARVTAVAPGIAVITATIGGLSTQLSVRVHAPLPPGAGTITVLEASVIEFQYDGGGHWFYAPMIRVATGDKGVDLTRLTVGIPGIGTAPPFCASIRMEPFATHDLNREYYGDFQFTIDAADGSRATAGATFPATLEYRNGNGDDLTLHLDLPVQAGSPPTTYSGRGEFTLWHSCRP